MPLFHNVEKNLWLNSSLNVDFDVGDQGFGSTGTGQGPGGGGAAGPAAAVPITNGGGGPGTSAAAAAALDEEDPIRAPIPQTQVGQLLDLKPKRNIRMESVFWFLYINHKFVFESCHFKFSSIKRSFFHPDAILKSVDCKATNLVCEIPWYFFASLFNVLSIIFGVLTSGDSGWTRLRGLRDDQQDQQQAESLQGEERIRWFQVGKTVWRVSMVFCGYC